MGCVNAGIKNNAAAFAVQTIRCWWQNAARVRYPRARRMLIAAGGCGNGSRRRPSKRELPRLANDIGTSIEIDHFPPETRRLSPLKNRRSARVEGLR